jgi:hypothetical protein
MCTLIKNLNPSGNARLPSLKTALSQALGIELLRGTMLTSYESVVIELTGRRSGRCVEFRMRDHEGVWWVEEDDILRQRPG